LAGIDLDDAELRAAPLYGDTLQIEMKGPKNIQGFTYRD